MSGPVVCDSKSPREMTTDLNLQGNGHHSDILTYLACINTWHSTSAQMHPLIALIPAHEHTAVMYSQTFCVCVCVCYLPSQTLLCLLCYKLFLVPGAPLVVSDRFGRCCFFALLSVLLSSSGVQCLPVYSWRITKKLKESKLPGYTASGRMLKDTWVEIQYLNLPCSSHLNP